MNWDNTKLLFGHVLGLSTAPPPSRAPPFHTVRLCLRSSRSRAERNLYINATAPWRLGFSIAWRPSTSVGGSVVDRWHGGAGGRAAGGGAMAAADLPPQPPLLLLAEAEGAAAEH